LKQVVDLIWLGQNPGDGTTELRVVTLDDSFEAPRLSGQTIVTRRARAAESAP
jgi:hypothetical protein